MVDTDTDDIANQSNQSNNNGKDAHHKRKLQEWDGISRVQTQEFLTLILQITSGRILKVLIFKQKANISL